MVPGVIDERCLAHERGGQAQVPVGLVLGLVGGQAGAVAIIGVRRTWTRRGAQCFYRPRERWDIAVKY